MASTHQPGPITLDVVGLELTPDDCRRIEHPLTGGVILFGRNFANRKQLTALTASIKALRPDVLISIDHEGGRVQRCRADGFTHLPAMRKLDVLARIIRNHKAKAIAMALNRTEAIGLTRY